MSGISNRCEVGGGGHGVLARLTFTDRCNKITCFTRHVHKEREGASVRVRGRELNRAALCSLFALHPGHSPRGEVSLYRGEEVGAAGC